MLDAIITQLETILGNAGYGVLPTGASRANGSTITIPSITTDEARNGLNTVQVIASIQLAITYTPTAQEGLEIAKEAGAALDSLRGVLTLGTTEHWKSLGITDSEITTDQGTKQTTLTITVEVEYDYDTD